MLVSKMIVWKRAVVLGLVSWAIPFVIAFPLFPIKAHNAPLYNTILNLIGLTTAAWLLSLYFRGRSISLREAGIIGAFWAAMNLVLDAPFFSLGPMRMTGLQYLSEIGLGYLALPIFAVGAARLAR